MYNHNLPDMSVFKFWGKKTKT